MSLKLKSRLKHARKSRANELRCMYENARESAVKAAEQIPHGTAARHVALAHFDEPTEVEVRVYSRDVLRQDLDRAKYADLFEQLEKDDPPGHLRVCVQIPNGDGSSFLVPIPTELN